MGKATNAKQIGAGDGRPETDGRRRLERVEKKSVEVAKEIGTGRRDEMSLPPATVSYFIDRGRKSWEGRTWPACFPTFFSFIYFFN